MNRGDFVAGMQVRLTATGQIFTLGGTIDDWICTDPNNPGMVPRHVQPEEVEPVVSNAKSTAAGKPPK
jgi:hypothetical protein